MHFFPYRYPVGPAPFTEKTILSLLYCSINLLMNQVTEYARFGYTFYVDRNCDKDRSHAERRARVKLWSQGILFSSLVLSYISKCMPGTGDKMVSKKRMSLTSQNVWCSRKDNYNIKQ